ncbi:MAG: FAD-binding oxidoreductase [Pseudonocardia sp.]
MRPGDTTVTPTTTVCPTDPRAVRAAILDTAGPMAIAGAGTAATWGGTLGPVDTILDTTGLTGVIAHNPGDMTVSVHAGTPLRELAAELAPHGQHVAFDPARAARGATVGGLVATADAGPSALVHGSLRDLVIGATVVLADGAVARSGGHVIKNVAGYDLTKILHGSYGTLGVIVEVVLRLHPVPRRTATLTLDCPLADATGHAARVLGSPLEPAAVEWVSGDPGTLLIRLDGTEDALPARVQRLRALLGAAATEAPTQSDERHSRRTGSEESAACSAAARDPSVRDPWARHAELVRGGAGRIMLRVGALPGRLPGLLASLPGAAAPDAAITAGLGTGVATVALGRVGDVGIADVAAAHAAVHAAGGTSALRDRPAGLDAPAWGPPPSAIAVVRAVKKELDPDGRLGPGRFAPWFDTTEHGTTCTA